MLYSLSTSPDSTSQNRGH